MVTRRTALVDPPPAEKRATSLQFMTRMVQRAVNTLNSKISELESRITATSTPVESADMSIQGGASNLQTLVQPGPSTMCYPMAPMSIEKPKFPTKSKHPVTFIEDLTAYLRKCVPGVNDIIDTIIECLEGDSRNWARIYRDRWTHFEDFKKDFLDTYWGEAEQNELRRKIVQNSWDGTQSMLSHFITLCGQAKMLTYPIQERQLISDIMNHFPREVQYAWSTSNYTSILQATEFLRKLDNVNRQTNPKRSSATQAGVVQQSAASGQHHQHRQHQQRDNRSNFKQKKSFSERPAREVNQLAKTDVVNSVDTTSGNTSQIVNSEPTNLN